ncbi:16S rRNA (guanine(527)-N(7))-methyltransferase RsmG [Thalassospira lucentensis]|uniref:16S rRNA (guanine(527)-N(7))-methyltransferase RsmG n=1 Tax=Thalassospira lucentensis TaxID=168935 RepID=UPI001FE0B8D0|nr:16S rRNA (guanine(527)-N(7))-methyltransferase RsmG [Thalassospira lucentensis]
MAKIDLFSLLWEIKRCVNVKSKLACFENAAYKSFMQSISEPVKTWFERDLSVSRETLDRLSQYADLVVKWQPRINIVGASTAEDVWGRHLQDSAQLWPHLQDVATTGKIVDFGSGAGFPGIVLAILGAGDITMMESNTKKTVFLMEAARVCGVLGQTKIARERIEAAQPCEADVVTARAFAPLPKLLEFGQRHLKPGGHYVLLKGRAFEDELADARDAGWTFDVTTHASLVDPDGVVMILKGVSR